MPLNSGDALMFAGTGGMSSSLTGLRMLQEKLGQGQGGPAQASIDPALQKNVEALQGAAGQYRSNLGNLQSQKYEGSANEARRGLAQKMADIKAGASSRGLLYSGLRKGEEAAAAGASASGLAAERANINKQTENQAQQMENSAISAGMDLQKQKQQIADYNANQQLQSQQQKSGLMKGLGGAAGGLIGTAAGGR